MEKIFKKSLALMVSAALCLTAFVGCLTVNAEATATPTYTITAQNGKAGDTVTVNVDGNNLTSVCGQQVFINIPAALTIASVKDKAGNPYINVANVTEGDAFDYSVVTTETTKQVRFADIINFPATGSDGAIATAEFHIVFELTIPDTAAVGDTYDIAFDTKTMFANINENEIGITVTPKTITVQAAQTHTHTWGDPYMNTEDGKWYSDCASCTEKKEVEANVVTTMGVSRSIIISDKIGIKFTVQASAQANALAIYDDYFIRVNTQSYNGNYNLEDVSVDIASNDTYDVTSSLVSYSYMNVTSYELTVPINTTVYYMKDGKIVACSKTYTDTLAERAMVFAKKYDYSDLTSASAKEGVVYLNLIKYGIEAQTYFAASNTSADIATAELPSFETGYENYVSTELPELTEIKSNVKAEGITAAMSRNVIVGPSNALLYKLNITSSTVPSNADLSKLTLEVSYTSSASQIGTVTETVALSDLELVSGTYRYTFDKITLYDLNQQVTAKLYSTDSTEPLIINTYSVETDAVKNLNNGTNVDVWKAMVIFGHSARAFFGYE